MTLDTLLKKHQQELDRLNNERRLWLWSSSIVFAGIIFLIFGWEWISGIGSRTIWWLIISLMLLISVNWWYWTMKVVRVIICYQEIEFQLIKEIHDQIKKVKIDLKEAFKLSGL